jgi:hypothetical protein
VSKRRNLLLPEYKYVYRNSSFDDWDKVIDILKEWDVWVPSVFDAFKKLKVLRNRSIHFNSETELNMKADAIEAIELITIIIDKQFGSIFSTQDWYISDIPGGVTFIKKEYEEIPFVKEILNPNSELVGYKHKMVLSGTDLVPEDNH